MTIQTRPVLPSPRRRIQDHHQARVLAYLTGHPGQTTQQIAAALGLHTSVIRYALTDLEALGEVARGPGVKGARGRPAHRWSLS